MAIWSNFFKRFSGLRTKAKYRTSVFLSYPKTIIGVMMGSTLALVYFIRAEIDQDLGCRLLSKQTGILSELQIPVFMRSFIYGYYAKRYGVNLNQVEMPLNSYPTFSSFFTRKITRGLPPLQSKSLSSPCDGQILSFQQITGNQCPIIKGHTYKLSELLLGLDQTQIDGSLIQIMKKQKKNKLYQVIIYLAPGDYHRFHSPTSMKILKRKQIDGYHYPVNQQGIRSGKKVYQKNARICLFSEWAQGLLAMAMVGALNVSRIEISRKSTFQRGEELGYFNLGSTIVMLIEAKNIKQWKITQGSRVRYGQALFQYE